MNKEEALRILKISRDLSDHDIFYQVKQQLKKLHNDNTDTPSEKIEACKLLTDGQKNQAEVFSDCAISVIKDNKLDFLELLLKTVKNNDELNYLNTESAGGNIPLNFALGYTIYKHDSRVKAIKLLLEYGAKLNTKDREGKLSLHCVINNSAGNFCHKVTELLLDHEADPNTEDNQGKTLLHYLLEDSIHDRGANPNIQNGRGESLLYEACSQGHDDVVKLLLEHGTGLDVQSEKSKSLLHKACSAGHDNIVKLLLEKGADPGLKDKNDKKPIDHGSPNLKGKNDKKPIGRVFPQSDGGKPFNSKKAFWLGVATILAIVVSIALISGVADAYIGEVWCFVLAVVIIVIALCCAYCAKTQLPPGPSSVLYGARAESSSNGLSPTGGA